MFFTVTLFIIGHEFVVGWLKPWIMVAEVKIQFSFKTFYNFYYDVAYKKEEDFRLLGR